MLVHQLKTIRQSCRQEELLSSLACTHSCHRNDSSTSSHTSYENLDEAVSEASWMAVGCNSKSPTYILI